MQGYSVIYTEKAYKSLKKIDMRESRKILLWIEKNLVNCKNPRIVGKPLKGKYEDVWRFRVGAYRIIASIQDNEMTIEVFTFGHRKDIYSKKSL